MTGSDAFDLVSVVLVDNLSENFNVLGRFFKSVSLSFKSTQDVGLSKGLGSLELIVADAAGKALKFRDGSVKDVASIARSTSNTETEKTSIREVEVDGTNGIDPVVFIDEVLVNSAWGSSTTSWGGGRSNQSGKDLESEDVLTLPRSRSKSKTNSEVIVFSLDSVFTSDVVGSFSGVGAS